jgi:transposase
MRLMGVDLHTKDESIAMVDTETGETREFRRRHDGDEVERFYSSLAGPVTVGIEGTGYALWFHHRAGARHEARGCPPSNRRQSRSR